MVPDWFLDAKLGIFIHWGIYAVQGIDESWAFRNGHISHREYMKQLDGFTASNWHPDEWAELFLRSGAKYAVLTAKHHDGVALFDTSQTTPSLRDSWPSRGLAYNVENLGHEDDSKPLSTTYQTPAGRDLIRPYLESLRKAGLRTGLYFSHLDWSHGDYASPVVDAEKENRFEFRAVEAEDLSHPLGEGVEGAVTAWSRFRQFHLAQLEELCTQYGEIDLIWFDGDWEGSDEAWEMATLRKQLGKWQPNMVVNSRMRGHGDYDTPEQGLPILITAPIEKSGEERRLQSASGTQASACECPWEFCMTLNDSWGYQGRDTNYKSSAQIIRLFAEIVGMGGNLLLDIGPKEDGTIPPEQVERLEALGYWIRPNAEAIYGSRAGMPHGHFFGPSTLSKDQSTLYLFIFGDSGGLVAVRGLKSGISTCIELASGKKLDFKRNGGAGWLSVPGILWIELPKEVAHPIVTVIKLELDGQVELHRG